MADKPNPSDDEPLDINLVAARLGIHFMTIKRNFIDKDLALTLDNVEAYIDRRNRAMEEQRDRVLAMYQGLELLREELHPLQSE